jgi:uncharacterized protein YjdB
MYRASSCFPQFVNILHQLLPQVHDNSYSPFRTESNISGLYFRKTDNAIVKTRKRPVVTRAILLVLASALALISCSCGVVPNAFVSSSPKSVTQLVVTPATSEISVGSEQQFTATAKNGNGDTVTGVNITWSSEAKSVASVNANGVATGIGQGTADITAVVEGVSASAALAVQSNNTPTGEIVKYIVVTPQSSEVLLGNTQQFSAAAYDANGILITGVNFAWSSSVPSVATVNNGGLATAVGVGSDPITATAQGVQGSASLTVLDKVATVTVTPTSAQVLLGGTQQFSAAAYDANGILITGVSFAWSSDTSSVATVNSSGLAAAIGVGTAHITATAQGVQGSASLTVLDKVATVTVTPASAQVLVGGTQQFSAAAYDANGVLITGVSFAWSSDTSSVASVNSNGLATAIGVGTAHITATDQGVQGSASLTVLATLLPVSPELFGLTLNNTSYAFPSVPFGVERIWDTSNVNWPGINKANGKYSWDNLDSVLMSMKANGVLDGFYTLSRTPNWAVSEEFKDDTSCNYAQVDAPGECDPPYDLNSDGSGADQIWRDWVAAIGTHIINLDPEKYAQIKYWEPWNEIDRSSTISNHTGGGFSYQGTFAQMVRIVEDARCIIKGTGQITATQESCADVLQTVGLTAAVDPNAVIVMPSSHITSTASLAAAQNFLYCNGSGQYAPPPSSECITANAGAAAVDAINFHIKVPTQPTEYFGQMIGLARGVLQSAELAKPFINGESGFGEPKNKGFIWADADMQASFVARYYFLTWSLGVQNSNWYTWDEVGNGLWTRPIGPITKGGTAYGETYKWMVGALMTVPCAGPAPPATGIWTCQLSRSSDYQAEAIWDTSLSCADGECQTISRPVDPVYVQYRDLDGNTISIVGNMVPVGVKPILLENR